MGGREGMIPTREQVDYCMECGVCTGSCPVSRVIPAFSPRQMIKRALMDKDDTILHGRELWACLTCARCSVRCPVAIDFPELARWYRGLARKEGNLPQLSHQGTLQAIMTLQTRNIRQKRTAWASEVGKFKASGGLFYFVGCAPYFDAALKYGSTALNGAKNVLMLLNRMGIEPVMSDDERCCGHDAFWSGDEETFIKLASKNVELIKATGARTVLFSCPEGYTTFKEHVPGVLGDLPFEVLHVTELLGRELPGSGVTFAANGGNGATVTYQDPCRLGRKAGIYDAPRDLLKLVPDVQFEEMGRHRENAQCCGTSAWIECSSGSKALQVERLEEARETGATKLITACPKCRIHFNCAKSNTDLTIEIVDLYSFLLDHVAKE
jgi:heterodisulfide reductase subunit D